MRLPSRRTLVWLAGALAALVVVSALALAAGDDNRVGADGPLPERPVLVGTVSLSGSTFTPGEAIVARVSLRADRRMVLRNLVVQVRNRSRPNEPRDPAQRRLDLTNGAARFVIGEKPSRTELTNSIAVAGTYRYNIAYEWQGRSYSLPPYETFVVR